MYISLKDLIGLKILAKDGEIGKSGDFYFDDVSWNIRYIIVDTGSFLTGKQVLISHNAFKQPENELGNFPIDLTKNKIKNSPSIAENLPVSRQMEQDLALYYQWPFYWNNSIAFSADESSMLQNMWTKEIIEDKNKKKSMLEPHLRSFMEVKGYNIAAMDDNIGQVDDFLVDNITWKIRYLVIDTRKWLPGGKNVLISPAWIEGVDWSDKSIHVNQKSDVIKNSPEYDNNIPISKDFEIQIFKYYGKHKNEANTVLEK